MTLRSHLHAETSAIYPERRAIILALACGALSVLFLYGAVRTAAESGDTGAGRSRSTWLDGQTSSEIPGDEEKATFRAHSAETNESSGATNAVVAAKETRQRTRSEDHGLAFPSHGMLSEELAVRRALGELEAGEQARAERANAVASACTSGCEEGADALDSQSSFARDRMAEGRARLVSRTETMGRVARTLEFIEE